MSPVKHSTSGNDLRNLTLGSSQRSSSRNENFMALLQKKGSKSSSGGARVSAMELLKSTNPLARRVTEFSTTPSTTGEGGDTASSKPNDQWGKLNQVRLLWTKKPTDSTMCRPQTGPQAERAQPDCSNYWLTIGTVHICAYFWTEWSSHGWSSIWLLLSQTGPSEKCQNRRKVRNQWEILSNYQWKVVVLAVIFNPRRSFRQMVSAAAG